MPTAIAAVNALIAHVCDAALTPSEEYEETPQWYSSMHSAYATPLCEERACFYERR